MTCSFCGKNTNLNGNIWAFYHTGFYRLVELCDNCNNLIKELSLEELGSLFIGGEA